MANIPMSAIPVAASGTSQWFSMVALLPIGAYTRLGSSKTLVISMPNGCLGSARQGRESVGGQLGPAIMNLLPIHRDRCRGCDTHANAVAFHREDGQADVSMDDDFLTDPARKNQHGIPP